jgi:hypothetical protein
VNPAGAGATGSSSGQRGAHPRPVQVDAAGPGYADPGGQRQPVEGAVKAGNLRLQTARLSYFDSGAAGSR